VGLKPQDAYGSGQLKTVEGKRMESLLVDSFEKKNIAEINNE